MSLRSVFLRSRLLLGQLIKHQRAQNEVKHKFSSDRHCYHRVRGDADKTVFRRSSNLFQRYGLFRALPEANFKGFASVLRRSATMRLMASRDQVLGRGSLFAFVGISMVGTGLDSLHGFKSSMEEDSYEDFCSIIRNSFKGEKQESAPDVPDHVSGYEFQDNPLGNGCNGLIFAARVKDEKAVAVSDQKNEDALVDEWVILNEEAIHTNDEDGWNVVEVDEREENMCQSKKPNSHVAEDNQDVYPVAIKMTFNFFASSNSDDIFREYERELVPLKSTANEIRGKMASMQLVRRSPLKHPNVVTLYTAFVDDEFPRLDYILEHHPACLPSDLNPGHGLGRSKTLFVAMKRYDMNLKQYLHRCGGQSERVTMIMLAQLLEGVAYLVSQGIAHRDLKSDNILVEIHSGACRLIITDFGCCLAQDDRSLSLPYTSAYIDRGGNSALMAPEVKLAVAGEHTTISYWKSDAWAVGTIAYEIAGLPNPFSASQNTGTKYLDSRSYQEMDLPSFGNTEYQVTQLVCLMLLKRNPRERLTAEVAANILHLFLWQPQYWKSASWHTGHVIPTRDHVIDWLGMLYAEQCMKRILLTDPHDVASDRYDITEDCLCRTFLQRVYLHCLMEAVNISQTHIIKEFLASGHRISLSKL